MLALWLERLFVDLGEIALTDNGVNRAKSHRKVKMKMNRNCKYN